VSSEAPERPKGSKSMNSPTPQSSRYGRFRDQYGPWAVVTGASDGIGREIAHRLAERGLNLVVVARRKTVLEELAAELSGAQDVDVRACAVDLAERDGWRAVTAACDDLDVGLLVASAGFGTSGELIDGQLESELAMIDVNCRALLAVAHQFGQRLVARGRGGIVLMSSLVGFQGVPYAANYAATKAYVQSLAEGLRLELAPRGVDVLASAPGPIRSGFAERANMRMNMAQTPAHVAAATLDALGRKTTVRPGFLAKFLEASLSMLPRRGRVRVMKLVMGGMTSHQRTPGALPAPK